MSCSKCDFNNSIKELNKCKNPVCNIDDPFIKKLFVFREVERV